MAAQIKKTVTGSEWITNTDMKVYLKVDYTTDDTLITALITAAREQAELYCNRSFIAQTIEYDEVDWSNPIKLPFPNHNAITEVKIDGTLTTDYTKTGLTQFAVTMTASGSSDKELYIKYTALGSPTESEKNALKRIVADMYETRNNTLSENGMVWLLPFKNYS